MANIDMATSSSSITGNAGFGQNMAKLETATQSFGASLNKALSAGVTQGKGLDDVLQKLEKQLLTLSLNAAMKPLQQGLAGIFGNSGSFGGGIMGGGGDFLGGSGFSSGFFSEAGAGFSSPDLGGDGIGAWGGAGASSAGGASAASTIVNMSIATPDAESFTRSESQVSAALARAVTRGQRGL